MTNPGHVILHIGPPKTATTSLQRLLGEFTSDRFYFGGVTQPRKETTTDLARRLHRVCAGNAGDASEVRQAISKYVEHGRDVVISEEMFLVDRPVAHQAKLQKLRKVLSGLPVTLVVCVRDPVAGLQSLYQQVFPNLSLREKLSFRTFLKSNQARVFDYGSVQEATAEAGFAEVRYISFDRLVAGRLSWADLLGADYPSEITLKPELLNAGKYVDPSKRDLDGVAIKDTIGWLRNLPPGVTAFLNSSTPVRRLWQSISTLSITPDRERELVVPSSVATRLRAEAERVAG